MIAYRDFVPKMTAPAALLRAAQYETFDAAVAAAQQWVAQGGVRVINVETVVLPNIWNPREEGTRDAALGMGDLGGSWHQFVRVWYEAVPIELRPV